MKLYNRMGYGNTTRFFSFWKCIEQSTSDKVNLWTWWIKMLVAINFWKILHHEQLYFLHRNWKIAFRYRIASCLCGPQVTIAIKCVSRQTVIISLDYCGRNSGPSSFISNLSNHIAPQAPRSMWLQDCIKTWSVSHVTWILNNRIWKLKG